MFESVAERLIRDGRLVGTVYSMWFRVVMLGLEKCTLKLPERGRRLHGSALSFATGAIVLVLDCM